MAHEAQLRMLRYQLNPHFLFNTLNAISTLILDADKKTANDMVSKLSNFLRYSLDTDPLKKVDLNHEVATLELYLDIEKVRFEERLRVSFNIDEGTGDALIPSMLLQPLVENSIKYAIADSELGGKITITARTLGNEIVITVTDDGPGIEMKNGQMPEFRGVGIKNIQDRLETLYGNNHSCRISPALPHGLKVEIRIPYEVDTQSAS
jgi:LytS/YehU family sensor histidine kinase